MGVVVATLSVTGVAIWSRKRMARRGRLLKDAATGGTA